MKKMCLLVLCLMLGALALTGCSGGGEPFAEKEYTVGSDQVSKVCVDVRDRQIEVALSDDDQIHIAYAENSKEYYDISVSDDKVLTMTAVSDKGWTDYVGGKPSASARKITLRLPNELLDTVNISTTNEDISLASFTARDEISLHSNGGNVSFDLLNAGKAITLNAKNGNVEGSVAGGYDDFAIQCDVKKGKCNLPALKEGGARTLSVTVNNGDADIEMIP